MHSIETIGKSEVKQKASCDRKVRNKKNKVVQVHFIPSLPSNHDRLQVKGHPKFPPAQHKEITRSCTVTALIYCLLIFVKVPMQCYNIHWFR